MFIPHSNNENHDILATSGETLKIWNITDDNKCSLHLNLVNVIPISFKLIISQESEFSAPLTSFDWNINNQQLIGTSSIDTTCTIWDINKGSVFTQLIAHDKEVYDISFSPNVNMFASVGADGSAR